jgi:glycosyltransferase involved in cell wall biosynthesis
MARATLAIDARLVGRDATGDSTYWSGLLLGLARASCEFDFLLFSNDEKPDWIPDVPHFHWTTLASRRQRWWSLFRFPLTARRMGARAIHTQYNLSPLAGRRGITTIHDVSFLIEPDWFRPVDRVLLTRVVPGSAKRAAAVITVSETSKSEISRLLPIADAKVRVTTLASGPFISPMDKAKAREAVRSELGIEGPYVLTVGTRWPRKNMELAVSAVGKLPGTFVHRLAITGKSGWGDDSLNERCVPTGYVSNELLSALYSAADLYLAPSKHEGFGIPILEAFTCGCPVLCSSGGAQPEVAGDAAAVLESWSPNDWAASIRVSLTRFGRRGFGGQHCLAGTRRQAQRLTFIARSSNECGQEERRSP